MSPLQHRLCVFLQILLFCHCQDIEPWTVNSTGEYYLFHSRPDDATIRNLTCHQPNCVIRCNEEESCQKFNIHGSNATHINLECDYPEIKELRPGSCWRANIFTQNASNFNVYCTTENCAETKFYVNHTYDSYFIFDGDWAAKHASIFAAGMKHNLSIICNDTESCSDLNIHCPSNTECHLDCNGTKACFNGNIHTDNISQLKLNCNYSDNTACSALTVYCTDNISNTLWFDTIDNKWKCFYDSECCPFQHKQNNIQICEHETECVIDCSAQYGCNWAVINAVNANSLTLKCSEHNECKLSTVYCPVGDKARCDIDCVGEYACQYMKIHSDSLRAIDIHCRSRSSCHYITVNATVAQHVSIECDDEWSCANAVVHVKDKSQNVVMKEDKMLYIECNGRYSCEGMLVYCPYATKHSCLLKCSDDDSSCGGIQLFALAQYEYDYLEIKCPTNATSTLQPCNFMKVVCAEAETSTVLRYLNNEWKCSNDRCCPWIPVIANEIIEKSDDKQASYSIIIAVLCGFIALYALRMMFKKTDK